MACGSCGRKREKKRTRTIIPAQAIKMLERRSTKVRKKTNQNTQEK